MKNANKVSVTSKSFRTSKYFRFFIILLLVALVVMSGVLIKMYIEINHENSSQNGSGHSIIANMDKNIEEYEIYESDEGFLGISDREKRIIIEPVWEEIIIISENRFIVKKTFGNSSKMGVIDCDSNIVVPMIFDSFSSLSNEFVGGFIENGFVLFDKKVQPICTNVWTSYKFSDGIIYLNDDEDEYRGKIANGKFQFIYLGICREAGGMPFEMIMTEQQQINTLGIDNAKRIADIAQGYLLYLISGNEDRISDLTTSQYLSSLLSNAIFADCEIKSITDCRLEITEEKSKDLYSLKMMINYDYSKDDVTVENISSEIIFNMVKDENNRIVLKSINKTEL